VADRTISVRGTAYPLILPSVRDPRLHVAGVILTVHALGQIGLHFAVSIPQILAAIVTCAVIEVAITFRQKRAFVWPASAMLTGSGVALILRVVGTPPDQPWYTADWYVFAGVAAFSLMTKYVIRYQGGNLFNPSNIGLVIAFIVLGNARVEPLDFWWAPLNVWMIAAYLVIVVGGGLIIRRLHLLALAVTFWVALAVGTAVLAASGHCMTANWAFEPVCGVDYWRTIVTSPEVLIFTVFMITDPRVVPAGRVGRVVFGMLVAVACVLLMAPQTDEFGSKVALLAGLTVICAARPVLDRLVPAPRSAADDVMAFARRLATGSSESPRPVRAGFRLGLMAVVVAVVGAGVVLAGTPARAATLPNTTEALIGVPHQINPGTLPPITVSDSVWSWDSEIAGSAPQLLVILDQNLAVEGQALIRSDGSLLEAVDHGDRLKQMQARLAQDTASGTTMVDVYRFDKVHVTLIVPFGVQTGLSLGFDSTGTDTQQTYDSAGHLISTSSSPFACTFAIRRATGARWLDVAVLPPKSGN
jgi:Na+-translocating ferredoxin:NAD+ oxidoreductase RnfD subunit